LAETDRFFDVSRHSLPRLTQPELVVALLQ